MAKPPVRKKPTPEAARDHIALADGWCAGQRIKKGDIVSLTPSAARYENVEIAPSGKTSKAPAQEATGK